MKRPDSFFPASPERLLSWLLADLPRGRAFGIDAGLFFTPRRGEAMTSRRFGRLLETPLGAAAGPHTQLAQNIVSAWLCGARFLELKTVQAKDDLELTKPCIQAGDEGYNCEWSQELSLEESFGQYLAASVLIHALRRILGHPEHAPGDGPGFILNMSAGYDLAGVTSPPMRRFLDRMASCPEETAALRERLARLHPPLKDLPLPDAVSDNLTLSTMHGCPPEEIGRIARHFLEERGLNVSVKLNPTLLGAEAVRGLVNGRQGFAVDIPDRAFAHDLRFEQALELIDSLAACARKVGRAFGVKLTNTLEVVNPGSLPDKEAMLYLSGRALHPVAVALAARLRRAVGPGLDISFCAGADAFNAAALVRAGLAPVTLCTDLLKPGGYGRLAQCVETLRREADCRTVAASLEPEGPWAGGAAFFREMKGETGRSDALKPDGPGGEAGAVMRGEADQTAFLEAYAAQAADDPRYRKAARPWPSVKNQRPLPFFDCAQAPCLDGCAAGQDIPGYLAAGASGRLDEALEIIRRTNPFPALLGTACDRLCQPRCVRTDYDRPVRIREVKLVAARRAGAEGGLSPATGPCAVAIRGRGLEGLSLAFFLARAGVAAVVHPPLPEPDGKLLATAAGKADLAAILAAGVRVSDEEAPATGAGASPSSSPSSSPSANRVPTCPQAVEASAPAVLKAAGPAKGPGGLPAAVGRGRMAALAWLEGAGAFQTHGADLAERAPGSPANTLSSDAARPASDDKGPLPVSDVGSPLSARAAQHGSSGQAVAEGPALPDHPDFSALARAKASRDFGPESLLTPADAAREAMRCLRCGQVCNQCVTVCPNRANLALERVGPAYFPLQRAVAANGQVRVETYGRESAAQAFQIVNLADFCNECGNCAVFCPSSGAPYRDKPRLHLRRESLQACGQGFHMTGPGRMEAQLGEGSLTLEALPAGAAFLVRQGGWEVLLDAASLSAREVRPAPGGGGLDLALAARAALVYGVCSAIACLFSEEPC